MAGTRPAREKSGRRSIETQEDDMHAIRRRGNAGRTPWSDHARNGSGLVSLELVVSSPVRRLKLVKPDHPRHIDRYIDYFGDRGAS
jgi:hypothetical protein